MPELTRRETLIVAAACACCAMTGTDVAEAADAPAVKPKSLSIGTLADYPKSGFYDKFAKQKVMIARLDDRLVAMTTVCTHKGCSVKVKPDAADPTLKCPCHKAEFSPYGTPTDGPAKTALSRYAISQADGGTITVDLTRSFIESKWDDKGAFVPLKSDGKTGISK